MKKKVFRERYYTEDENASTVEVLKVSKPVSKVNKKEDNKKKKSDK